MPEPNKPISPRAKEPRGAAGRESRRTPSLVLAPARHVPLDEAHEQAVEALEELLVAYRESHPSRESAR